MSKHTPGPWKLVACERGQKWAILSEQECCPDHDRLIAFVGEDDNARLIAAAPDLLAALEELDAWLSATTRSPQIDAALQERTKARAAIAQAKGEAK